MPWHCKARQGATKADKKNRAFKFFLPTELLKLKGGESDIAAKVNFVEELSAKVSGRQSIHLWSVEEHTKLVDGLMRYGWVGSGVGLIKE